MPNRNAGGGYSFGDTTLTGYTLTHISGPGCGAAGDVPILPMTGALPDRQPERRDRRRSANTGEVAQAGYYSAQSNGPPTPSPRSSPRPRTARWAGSPSRRPRRRTS